MLITSAAGLLALLGLPLLLFVFLTNRARRQRIQRRLAQKQLELADQQLRIRGRLAGLGISTREAHSAAQTLSAVSLQRRLADGRLTPTGLLYACQAQTVHTQDELALGGLGEFICEAEKWALELEARDTRAAPPLFGLPVSLKECIPVAGHDSPYGLVGQTGRPHGADCVVTRVLKRQGAVPFALTAMPPTGLAMDSCNPVYGRVTNPHSRLHSSGGSSGGEGALIAAFASPCGLGTDIGGSIRIPAAFCGIAGLKPTQNRLSTKGLGFPGRDSVFHLKAALGPMARTVDGLVLLMRALLTPDMFRLDRGVVPLPFDEAAFDPPPSFEARRLTIGYYSSFESEACVQAVPAVRRCVDMARQALERRGHRMVQFRVPSPETAHRLSLLALCPDGGEAILESLRDEPPEPSMQLVLLMLGLPRLVKRLLIRASGRLLGPTVAVSMAGITGVQGLRGLEALSKEIEEYRDRFHDAWTTDHGQLDVLIAPTMPIAAPLLSEDSLYILPAASYTMVYNLLDWPAGSLPASRVTAADLELTRAEAARLRQQGDTFNARVHDGQADSLNLPLGVQVVAPPYQEELVLRVMAALEEDLHYWKSD